MLVIILEYIISLRKSEQSICRKSIKARTKGCCPSIVKGPMHWEFVLSRMKILRICIWQLTQPELAMNKQVILHGGWIQSARCKLLIPQTDRLAVAKALHECATLVLWKDWLLPRFSIRPG